MQAAIPRLILALSGYPNAAADEKRIQTMADAGYACAAVWIFAAPGFHRSIWPEEILFEFEDGSSTHAKQLFLYSQQFSDDPVQSSVDGTITVDSAADPDESGRYLYVFVPSKYLEHEILEISYVES